MIPATYPSIEGPVGLILLRITDEEMQRTRQEHKTDN